VKRIFFKTRSTYETVRLGKRIGGCLQRGDVVALAGGLGAGKTQFIKGLAAGAGVKRSFHVASPSFTLVHEYPGGVPFYHIDLFRLATEKEAEDIGLEEYLQGAGITAIEWGDKIPSLLPREILWIQLDYAGEHSRTIEILGRGKRYEALLKDLCHQQEGLDSEPGIQNHVT
jgi:tRNA threonylcarbamoyladenosine biosynthesis protein TsaE